nr:GNAT family N-acetyltransferase [Candidatus Sigynarchaeota archaeon]
MPIKERIYCRGATRADIDAFGRVIDNAFGRSRVHNTGPALAASIHDLEYIRLACHDHDGTEEILGACPIRDYPCHYGPMMLKCGGLSLVGVDPAYQRKGVGQALLANAENFLHAKGYDMCMLFTGSPNFYRHQGWELCVETYFCIIPAVKIPAIPAGSKRAADKITVRPCTPADRLAIQALYEAFNKNRPLTRFRDDDWWSRSFSRDPPWFKNVIVATASDLVAGYARARLVPVPAPYALRYTEEPRVDITEYGVLPSKLPNLQRQIELELLAGIKAMAFEQGFPIIGTPLPGTYPMSNYLRSAGATLKDAFLSSRMVQIVNMQLFLAKLLRFQENIVILGVPRDRWKSLGPFKIGLAVEDVRGKEPVIIRYTSDGTAVRVDIDPSKRPSTLVAVSRKLLGVMTMGNSLPSDLVEGDLWACPAGLVPTLDALFPNFKIIVYDGDNF